MLDNAPDDIGAQELIRLALQRAPRVPEVHIDIGTLLFRMGANDLASRTMARAVELSPSSAERVVQRMLSYGLRPLDVAHALPLTAPTLLSLENSFFETGNAGDYYSLVDSALSASPSELLVAYGDAAIRAERTDDLIARLATPFERESNATAALRHIQRARAFVHERNLEAARAETTTARTFERFDPGVAEALGEVSIACGDPVNALQDLKHALAMRAAQATSPFVLGRIYRKIGQGEELSNHIEQAFDSYRRAISLNPYEDFARSRLRALESAAGLVPEPAESTGAR